MVLFLNLCLKKPTNSHGILGKMKVNGRRRDSRWLLKEENASMTKISQRLFAQHMRKGQDKSQGTWN